MPKMPKRYEDEEFPGGEVGHRQLFWDPDDPYAESTELIGPNGGDSVRTSQGYFLSPGGKAFMDTSGEQIGTYVDGSDSPAYVDAPHTIGRKQAAKGRATMLDLMRQLAYELKVGK